MPQDIHQPIEEAEGSCSAPKPLSFDFCGKHELDWDKIEIELFRLAARIEAVEFLGRQAIDRVHSQSMDDVFDLTASDMLDHVATLKTLLGLDREAHS
jgi:hypothetical protein